LGTAFQIALRTKGSFVRPSQRSSPISFAISKADFSKRVARIERMGSAARLADHRQRFANETPTQSVNRDN
jgi:hypothetical protein